MRGEDEDVAGERPFSVSALELPPQTSSVFFFFATCSDSAAPGVGTRKVTLSRGRCCIPCCVEIRPPSNPQNRVSWWAEGRTGWLPGDPPPNNPTTPASRRHTTTLDAACCCAQPPLPLASSAPHRLPARSQPRRAPLLGRRSSSNQRSSSVSGCQIHACCPPQQQSPALRTAPALIAFPLIASSSMTPSITRKAQRADCREVAVASPEPARETPWFGFRDSSPKVRSR